MNKNVEHRRKTKKHKEESRKAKNVILKRPCLATIMVVACPLR